MIAAAAAFVATSPSTRPPTSNGRCQHRDTLPRHAHRHEEEAEQESLEGRDVRFQLVAVSVPASSTPARKAPSAMESPAADQPGGPHHQQERGGGEQLLALELRHEAERRTQHEPAPRHDGGDDRRRHERRRQEGAPASAVAAPASPRKGSTASRGMTARSWNSRMPKEARPCRVVQLVLLRQQLQREGGGGQREPQAGDERRAPAQPEAHRPEREQPGRRPHLQPAEPEHRDPELEQALGLQLEADEEEQQDHAQLGEAQEARHAGMSAAPYGPMTTPAAR